MITSHKDSKCINLNQRENIRKIISRIIHTSYFIHHHTSYIIHHQMSYFIIIIILIADGHTTSHMKVNWKRGFDKSDVTENNSISLAQVRMWDCLTIRWECERVSQLVRMCHSLTILKLDQLNILTQFNLLCPVRLHGSIPRGIHRRNCGRSSTQHWIKNMVSKLFVKTYKSLGKCDTGEFPGVIMTIVLRRKIQYHLLQVGIFT